MRTSDIFVCRTRYTTRVKDVSGTPCFPKYNSILARKPSHRTTSIRLILFQTFRHSTNHSINHYEHTHTRFRLKANHELFTHHQELPFIGIELSKNRKNRGPTIPCSFDDGRNPEITSTSSYSARERGDHHRGQSSNGPRGASPYQRARSIGSGHGCGRGLFSPRWPSSRNGK